MLWKMIKNSAELSGYSQHFSLQTAWVSNVRLMDNDKTMKGLVIYNSAIGGWSNSG